MGKLTFGTLKHVLCREVLSIVSSSWRVLYWRFSTVWLIDPLSVVFIEVKVLESKRDAISIEKEENVTNYYKIRQQLAKLDAQMQVVINYSITYTIHVYWSCIMCTVLVIL